MAQRLKAMGQPKYRHGFKPAYHSKALDEPLRWSRPRRVFVCSMGDLFHPQIYDASIAAVFRTIRATPRHTYQVLTKRIDRAAQWLFDHHRFRSLPNVWLMTSAEDQRRFDERVPVLADCPAVVRGVSLEPLLGPIDVSRYVRQLDWVIVGGESGHGARPCCPSWVRAIRDECVEAGVPFLFKQWGGANKKKAGRLLEGRTWDEYPKERTP
jgi:protein gp37